MVLKKSEKRLLESLFVLGIISFAFAGGLIVLGYSNILVVICAAVGFVCLAGLVIFESKYGIYKEIKRENKVIE